MIKFSEFLSEGRDAPLYHGTTHSHASAILRSGYFDPVTRQNSKVLLKSKNKFESKDGVSLTRNFHFAKTYISGPNVVFQLNQTKLAQNFEIIPVQYFNTQPNISWGTNSTLQGARVWQKDSLKPFKVNEYEEFVLYKGKNITLSFVDKVWIPSDLHDDQKQDIQIRCADKGIPFEVYNA